MIGNPKYKEGDFVGVVIDGIEEIGTVYIVDAYGTFEQHEEPSYDILVERWKNTNSSCLIKHVRESDVTDRRKEQQTNGRIL